MDPTFRELTVFVTAADLGSFTEAAAQLHISQAAVSRTVAALEHQVGERLLRRTPRGCEPTPLGHQLLPQARRVLAEVERFADVAQRRHSTLRLGYSWAALGRHTASLHRIWASRHDSIDLELVRHNSATAGLAEGRCDVAIMRRPVDEQRFAHAIVGLEERLVAFATDDPQWSRRRRLSMAEIADRTVFIDSRVGSTTEALWPRIGPSPRFVESTDVDHWLDAIAAGRGVGTTAAATAEHHPRHGVTYRPIKDGPRIPVRLVWWRDAPPTGLPELVDTVTRLYATRAGAVP